jgi:hypothetical protein
MGFKSRLVGAGIVLLCVGLPAGASAAPVLDANCPPPRDTTLGGSFGGRMAETFTAQASGALTTAQLDITKGPGTTGDYLLQILAVGPSGLPTNTVLASTSVPNASVPNGDSFITGTFEAPATVTAGERYALMAARPPGTSTVMAGLRTGDDCPGMTSSGSPNGTDPFAPSPADWDIVFAVFVEPQTPPDTSPPDTTIAAGPKDKTKKKQATFKFSGTDARAIAGFECSLDGGAFAACASPHTVKGKKGKHTFSVRATDQAGNVGSPATDDWKVKKKKKKKKKK